MRQTTTHEFKNVCSRINKYDDRQRRTNTCVGLHKSRVQTGEDIANKQTRVQHNQSGTRATQVSPALSRTLKRKKKTTTMLSPARSKKKQIRSFSNFTISSIVEMTSPTTISTTILQLADHAHLQRSKSFGNPLQATSLSPPAAATKLPARSENLSCENHEARLFGLPSSMLSNMMSTLWQKAPCPWTGDGARDSASCHLLFALTGSTQMVYYPPMACYSSDKHGRFSSARLQRHTLAVRDNVSCSLLSQGSPTWSSTDHCAKTVQALG